MVDYEAGYLQALKDALVTIRQMVSDFDYSPEAKGEVLGIVSLIDDLIKTRVEPHGNLDAQDAPDPLSGGF